MPGRIVSVFRNLVRKTTVEQALDEELQSSVELLAEERIKKEVPPAEARRQALMELGGVEQVKEEVRAVRAGRWLEEAAKDVRYALRTLSRSPGFTAVAVLTLALGIGANTALFSIVNGVLLNPLRYAEPDRLLALYSRASNYDRSSVSYPNFLDWVHENRTFSALAAYRPDDFNLTGRGEPERAPAEMVSASFFPLLGVRPVLGRMLLPEEDQIGARPVVLISGGLWKRKFGSAKDVLGQSLTLNDVVYTIVGVMPADFHYTGVNFHPSDVYTPIGQWNEPTFHNRRASMGTFAVGRLKPGVTWEQAKADMDTLGRHLAGRYPEADKGTGIALVPLKQAVVYDIQPSLLVLMAAVGFVLLIACVNVANLSLARSTGRTHEFAIRAALGASRGRVVRQLLTESLLLALAGGGLGLLVACWGIRAALKVLPGALPRAEEVQLDGRVLWFTLAAAVLAGILFGLAPALKTSRGDLHTTLKEGGRGLSGARHRVQSAFVVAEMALALVLLAGAGLMTRSLAKLWRVDPGFDPHNVLTFYVSFPSTMDSPKVVRAAWRQLHDSLSAVPGVQAASLYAGAIPMASESDLPFWVEGQPKPSTQAEMKITLFYMVQPDYLNVMRTLLKGGRFFSPHDDEHSPMVAVIDESFARLYFGGQDPIGKHVNFGILNVTAEIVGVAGHVKQFGLDEGATPGLAAQCYLPIAQLPDGFIPLAARRVGVVARTAGSPLAQVGPIRHALGQVNTQLVMYETKEMDGIVADSLGARRFSMVLLGIFAALALVMSCVGIYGVIAYLAGQRTHEIGIRLALGAERWNVLRMVLGEGAKLALAGVAIGVVAGFGLTRLMANMLFGVSAHDPLSFAGVAGLLILVALAACYIPARRAAKVDPVVALRNE
jgi:predicted permease